MDKITFGSMLVAFSSAYAMYLLGALIAWEMSPSQWNTTERLIIGWVWVVTIVLMWVIFLIKMYAEIIETEYKYGESENKDLPLNVEKTPLFDRLLGKKKYRRLISGKGWVAGLELGFPDYEETYVYYDEEGLSEMFERLGQGEAE